MTEVQEMAQIIYIPDENGNDVEFEVVVQLDFEDQDKKYLMVTPLELEEGEEEGQLYAFRYEENGDELLLYTIEDEAEWQMVEDAFNQLVEENNDL